MCEEMYDREMDVAEEPDNGEESYPRQLRNLLHEIYGTEVGMLQNVVGILKKMESFCRTKKNMFLPIREDIEEALRELTALREYMEYSNCYVDHFEHHLRNRVASKIKKEKRKKWTASRSTPDTRKWLRDPTVSPEASVAMKQEDRRP